MKLKREKSVIAIQNKEFKVSLVLGKHFDHKKIDSDIVVCKHPIIDKQPDNVFVVQTAGEYESNNVFIQAVSSFGKKEIQLISLDIEGVNIIYTESVSVLPAKKNIEQLGINNILIYSFDESFENLKELVDTLDPNYLILISDNEEAVKTIAGKFSLVIPEKVGFLSVNASDFENLNEDRPMELILLS